MTNIIMKFKECFGQIGGEWHISNVGFGHSVGEVCRAVAESDDTGLFDYFREWDTRRRPESHSPVVLDAEIRLIQDGLWETAWSLAHAHFEQTQKKEGEDATRYHKGHPYCNLAILGQALGSNALTRHFASLSSIGDLYWMHKETMLTYGGLGPTFMQHFGSELRHRSWLKKIGAYISAQTLTQPLYLEAFLVCQWFGESHWEQFIEQSQIIGRGPIPFVEKLLNLVEADSDRKGKYFEAAAGLLLSSTPGFEVRSARKTTDEQIDLVVRYERDRLALLPLPEGPGLIECKASKKPVNVSALRDFGAKCQFHRAQFGILISQSGITGNGSIFSDLQYSELTRRRLLVDGIVILALNIDQLRGRSRDLRGLQEQLMEDYERLVFGPIDGAAE